MCQSAQRANSTTVHEHGRGPSRHSRFDNMSRGMCLPATRGPDDDLRSAYRCQSIMNQPHRLYAALCLSYGTMQEITDLPPKTLPLEGFHPASKHIHGSRIWTWR